MSEKQSEKNSKQITIIVEIEAALNKKLENVVEDTENWQIYYTEINGKVLALSLSGLNLKELPAAIGKLDELNYLNISNNSLTKIPDFINNLKKLAILNVGNNQIATIPNWIGTLNVLRELHLNNNQLYSLPSSIESLTLLRKIYLQSNNIHRIPFEILELNKLEEFHIDFRSTMRKSTKALLSNLESKGCRIHSDYNRR